MNKIIISIIKLFSGGLISVILFMLYESYPDFNHEKMKYFISNEYQYPFLFSCFILFMNELFSKRMKNNR